MPRHNQTPFVTSEGVETLVDEDLFEVLTELKFLGVETEYSCQSGVREPFPAYILCRGNAMLPLVRRIYKLYKHGQLTETSTFIVNRFLSGRRHVELAHFVKDSRFRLHKYRNPRTYSLMYGLEFSYSLRYGFRITVRFPHLMIPFMVELLQELQHTYLSVETIETTTPNERDSDV